MEKQFLRWLDSVLPLWVSKLPYLLALWGLKGILFFIPGVMIWNRNSTRLGSFVFGISDLDLTVILVQDVDRSLVENILKQFKKIFIFIGETNYYERDELPVILKRMNCFELQRDPELNKFLKEIKISTREQKFVFIQRMLFSDVFSLKSYPELRQKKWKSHFQLIDEKVCTEKIELVDVINLLKRLCDNNLRICDSLDQWVNQVFNPTFDIYHAHLGEGIGILAPQCRLWFEGRNETQFLLNLSQSEKLIFQAQINWEFCGLYSQKDNLQPDSLKVHLTRLIRAYDLIDKQDAFQLRKDISETFNIKLLT